MELSLIRSWRSKGKAAVLYLILAAVVCIGAGKEESNGPWRVTSGEWTCSGKASWQTTNGHLVYEESSPEEWTLSLQMLIMAWDKSKPGVRAAGILWGKATDAAGLLLTPTGIRIGSIRQAESVVTCPIPVRKPVPISLTITKEKVSGTVAGRRVYAEVRRDDLGRLRLYSDQVSVVFSDVRVASGP